jgi:hypothetical protein
MNQDRSHKPDAQRPVQPPCAEQGMTPSPLFDMSRIGQRSGEIVVAQQQPVVNTRQPWPRPSQQAGLVAGQSANPVSPQQQPQGQGLAEQHEAQLQRLCRRLRATHRCPGECVLSRARQNRRLRGFPDLR